jgi:hypothetical protein
MCEAHRNTAVGRSVGRRFVLNTNMGNATLLQVPRVFMKLSILTGAACYDRIVVKQCIMETHRSVDDNTTDAAAAVHRPCVGAGPSMPRIVYARMVYGPRCYKLHKERRQMPNVHCSLLPKRSSEGRRPQSLKFFLCI